MSSSPTDAPATRMDLVAEVKRLLAGATFRPAGGCFRQTDRVAIVIDPSFNSDGTIKVPITLAPLGLEQIKWPEPGLGIIVTSEAKRDEFFAWIKAPGQAFFPSLPPEAYQVSVWDIELMFEATHPELSSQLGEALAEEREIKRHLEAKMTIAGFEPTTMVPGNAMKAAALGGTRGPESESENEDDEYMSAAVFEPADDDSYQIPVAACRRPSRPESEVEPADDDEYDVPSYMRREEKSGPVGRAPSSEAARAGLRARREAGGPDNLSREKLISRQIVQDLVSERREKRARRPAPDPSSEAARAELLCRRAMDGPADARADNAGREGPAEANRPGRFVVQALDAEQLEVSFETERLDLKTVRFRLADFEGRILASGELTLQDLGPGKRGARTQSPLQTPPDLILYQCE